MTPNTHDLALNLFKALADETRLRCVLLIQLEGELCVCELMAALEEVQPKISRHLALLKQHQLLLDRRQGQWIYYRINPELPTWIKNLLTQVAESNAELVAENRTKLCCMDGRPIRACC